VNASAHAIPIVVANSVLVYGYCEKTNISPIHVGDPTKIELMGHRRVARGHVDSIAHAIDVSNIQPNNQEVAAVNPNLHLDAVGPGQPSPYPYR
jgi:multidrug resistance efflux pump